MSRPTNYAETIAGVPVHYDRYNNPRYCYGTRGKPYKFYMTQGFETKLNESFEDLWEICSLGKAEVIASAGAYVDKPGMHAKGRAIDIDALFWSDYALITNNYLVQTSFYLGVEAILRKHFGTVLNYLYNAAHKDHFHVDDGTEVGYSNTSKSKTFFLQAALVNLFEQPISVDGKWGDETSGAVSVVFKGLGIQRDIFDKNAWLDFLTQAANKAFGFVEPEEKDPLDLIRDLYKVIDSELENSIYRKPIETALSTFVNHPDTRNWLAKYE
ncbi:extensin family protein [Desulfobacter curvatus]|uniref:extensin family protein n=1 Tax=Desulfobacter curvatus TaxID=2290 RepID=UPI00036A20B1|nr:extensin family protein [Desulfobacter curvatus]